MVLIWSISIRANVTQSSFDYQTRKFEVDFTRLDYLSFVSPLDTLLAQRDIAAPPRHFSFAEKISFYIVGHLFTSAPSSCAQTLA